MLNQGLLSIVCVQSGPRKLFVIWSSGVSAIQGLLKYSSEWKDSRDFQNCPLYCGCTLLRVSVKQGSTVLIHYSICFLLYKCTNLLRTATSDSICLNVFAPSYNIKRIHARLLTCATRKLIAASYQVLLSSGCRETVESLPSVHSSSTVAELPRWIAGCQLHMLSAKFKLDSTGESVLIVCPCIYF